MKIKSLQTGMVSLLSVLMLTACGDNNDETDHTKENTPATEESAGQNSQHEGMDQEDMDMHSNAGDVPNDIKAAENPAYKVGNKAIMDADHMEGMNGAEAVIAGAYDTTAYTITYTPTDGGEPVENHKWVIQEEIENAGDQKLEPGTEVTLNADHMKGMDGAKAVIDSAKDTTVYMIDYMPTTGEDEVKNHKWVTEDELSAK
ncbi:MAG: YdhK family protein [Bacillus sp. (in: firmicutes)]